MMSLLRRFVKPEVLETVRSGADLVKLDVKKESNLLHVKEFDIGCGARKALSDTSGTGSVQLSSSLTFRREAGVVLQAITAKIQERSLFKYNVVKYISCLNPANIWSNAKKSC